MENDTKKPVLLIAFNRPDETKQVLDEISKYDPSKIYVSLDGPRPDKPNDVKLTEAVIQVLNESVLRSKIQIQRSSENLGCKKGVVAAIDWFFDNEECGIILEDDIIPNKFFFQFQNDMLNLYSDDTNVKAVLGFNYYGQNVQSNDHYLYDGFYPWGWGTWRRVWNEYDIEFHEQKLLRKLIRSTRSKKKYLLQTLSLHLQLIEQKKLDTWDYQFHWLLNKTGGSCVAPYANLTRNIGVNGAHSDGNRLNFKYGKFSPTPIKAKKLSNQDPEMNELLYSEHYHARHLTFIKTALLKLHIYSFIRLIKNYANL